MRIVITTGPRFRHLWMVNLAAARLGGSLCGVLVQSRSLPIIASDSWSRFKRSAKRTMSRVGLAMPVYLNLSPIECHLWLAHGEPPHTWQDLPVPVERTGDPNSPAAMEWLEQARPDLILVFGGRLLSAPWFERPRLGAMNLHYGITPTYRGADSTTWAAYHRNWSKIGASIHYIDAGIDTGRVIRHAPVQVKRGDTLDTLTARVYWSGIQALVNCASESVERNEQLATLDKTGEPSRFYASHQCTYEIREVADRNVRLRTSVSHDKRTRRAAAQADTRLRQWSETLTARPAQADRLPPGLYILLYHDVSPRAERRWGPECEISTEPELFEQHIEYLSRCGRWVDPDDGYYLLERNTIDEPLLLLSFDDGFASVRKYAREVIARHGIHPLLFLNGAAIAEGHVHYRVLSAILAAESRSNVLASSVAAGGRRGLPRPPGPQDLSRWLKRNYTEGWTDRVATQAYLSCHERLPRELYLDLRQTRELQSEGWLIGNHTWSHPVLARLRPDEIADQLERNERWLVGATGAAVRWVSYPYGFSADVGLDACAWVEADPSRIGVMAEGGVNFVLERTALRRIAVGDESLQSLRRRIRHSILQGQADQFQTVLGTR